MRVISTIISMFAAWLIIATPTMACCVTGHMNMTAVSTVAATDIAPPCHQTSKAPAADSERDDLPEKYCPSCDDCAFSAHDQGDNQPALTASSDIDTVTLAQISPQTIASDIRLPDSTAPPRQTSPPVDQPLYSTDSLLI